MHAVGLLVFDDLRRHLDYRFWVITEISSSLYAAALESFVTGKIMLYFDPSTMNIVLTFAVVALFAFFLLLLMKLNPSSETKRKTEDEFKPEKPKQGQPRIIMPQNPAASSEETEPQKPAEKPLILVNSSNTGTSLQTRQETRTLPLPLDQKRTIPMPEKTAVPPPSKPTPLPPSRKDCVHHFGYLRTFPKNSPIPDECFGCEKIVDCLVSNKRSK